MLLEQKLLRRVRIKLKNLIKMIPKLVLKRRKRILIMFQKAMTMTKDLMSQRIEECCLKLKAIKRMRKRMKKRMKIKNKKNLNKTKKMRKKIILNKNLNNQPLFLKLKRKRLFM